MPVSRCARPATAGAARGRGGRFKQALTATPGYLPARVGLAEALLEANDYGESRPMFESLIAEPPAAPAAEFGLGRIDAARGAHDRAVEHFQRAIGLFPEFGSAYYALALWYRALGRVDDARSALAKHAQYAARWPALDDPVRDTVAALRDDAAATLRRGVRFAETGDITQAIAAHEAALAKDPSLAQAHANLINLYGRAGNFVKAEEQYRTVVALGGDLSEAHYDYGVLLGLQDKWDLAADAYGKALALNPANVRARNNLGQVLERQRNSPPQLTIPEGRGESADVPAGTVEPGTYADRHRQNEDAIIELLKLSQPQDAETPRYMFVLSVAYLRAGGKGGSDQIGHRGQTSRPRVPQLELADIIEPYPAKPNGANSKLSAFSSQLSRCAVGWRALPP